jgi:ribosome-associated toxin RatA of RatAB toxin-antitoxin module
VQHRATPRDATEGKESNIMEIHFNDMRPANAPAAALFEVITDYASYPRFNKAVTNVRVVRKDDQGAEFVADRTTRIGKSVRAYDRYTQDGDFTVERTYDGNASALSTWTIHPVDADHSTLTIDAVQEMGPVRGVLMKPALKKLFYGINFTPFIEEAERRANDVTTR